MKKDPAGERSGPWSTQKAESGEGRQHRCVGLQGAVTQVSSWAAESRNPDTESWVRALS